MSQHPGVSDGREETDEPFPLAEMVRAINRSRPISPREDQICHNYAKASLGMSVSEVTAPL